MAADDLKARKCEFCGRVVSAGASVCISCGAPVPSAQVSQRPKGEKSRNCPACGTPLGNGVYRCPQCMTLFCFECRRPVASIEAQYQCLSQSCENYGKLICDTCTEVVADYEEQTEAPPKRPAVGSATFYNACTMGFLGCILGCQNACGNGESGSVLDTIRDSLLLGSVLFLITIFMGILVAHARGKPILDRMAPTSTGRSLVRHHRECRACHKPVRILNFERAQAQSELVQSRSQLFQ